IEYGKGKFVSVMPVKEQEFAELLEKRMFAKKIKATEAIDPVGSQADES
ncbi:ABC transporter, partial [Bacteroides ovatus]|nr:ABC transporter [Bacteroides ovatus]